MGDDLEARRGYRLLETFEDRRGGTGLGGTGVARPSAGGDRAMRQRRRRRLCTYCGGSASCNRAGRREQEETTVLRVQDGSSLNFAKRGKTEGLRAGCCSR